MIEVTDLTKYYGRLAAVKDLNFRIESGEIVGFLGPNGAGKTTTMRMLTCFTPPSKGTARIMGMDVLADSYDIRKKIGYLPENVPLYPWMRVESYLRFVAKAKGVVSSKQVEDIKRITEAVDIYSVRHRVIKTLSKGYRQRVGLAQAMIGDPPILILDEPTIGLDPRQIREIRQLIKGFARNRTVILSTHILPEVSQICDRVIIINKGSVIAEDTPRNLALSHGASIRAQITARADPTELYTLLSGLPHSHAVHIANENNGEATAVVESSEDMDIRSDIARAVLQKGWDLIELRAVQATLEDVFIDLVTEENDSEKYAAEDVSKEETS